MTEHTMTRRRAATRARILDAAAAVFAEKGLHGATIDDLVTAAGYTRGAFYSNFDTKEDVFDALFEQQSAYMVDLVREAVEGTPAEEFDLALITTVLERLRPAALTWYLIHTEFVLHAMRNEDAGRRLYEHSARFEREFADVLLLALERLGRRPRLAPAQLADVLSSLYLKALAQEASPGAPPREDFDTILPTVLLGLSEELGPED
ncbi:TetR/AcrR family transcriptional regulator [Cellulomonas bogoriensis]|uniref:Transcriptional regulator n=1 Tax=Cellulomonas bogoriensis 69B4 = DSM 16987 TaxID=1386082 RepID=A0A0A0BL62_9CELL|nr:TetR/AcrR family transcriptional regulator [Cellulomonas bogoriensis]KGM08701.1 transcriptional regulator [Cellulomonas bogoriensis 69B4 = DSM 16987]